MVAGYRRFYAIDQQLTSVTLEIEAALHPDLLMVLLQGIDRTSHHLWAGFEDPSKYPPEARFSAAQIERARAALESYYEFTDDLIGRLVSRYSEDDLVLVLSDHGFEAVGKGRLTGGHNSPAALDGVIFARGRHVRAGPVAEGLRIEDVTPTVLAWLGLPVARDMDGKPARFLDLQPAETIATWDTLEVERATEAASGSDAKILDQLEALGYVE
jgi:predicted AlkP superfamily phosphohydrolase/phosphomutase